MKKYLQENEVMRIPDLLKSKSVNEISDMFGVTANTIHRWIRVLRAKGYDIKLIKGRPRLTIKISNEIDL